jgi:hypothetical protein
MGGRPPGAAGKALISARDGAWLDFGLRLAVVLATLAVALLAWIWALGRRVSGGAGEGRSSRRHRSASALPLTQPILRGLPEGPTRAAMSQQLRYFFLRSPRAIQTLVIPPAMGVVVAHASFSTYGLAAQTAAFAAMSVVSGSFNLFGYDGQGFTYLVLGGAPLRRVLVGKAIAPLVYLVPLVIVFAVVEATIRASTLADIPSAVLAGASVVALGLGVGSAASVMNPSDQSRVGQRRGSFLKVFAWFMGFFAIAGVGGIAWVVAAHFLGDLVTGLVAVVAAAAFARLLVGWSARRLDRDPYQVMRKLDPRTA